MLVNIKVTGGLNIESGHIDPKATGGLKKNAQNISRRTLSIRTMLHIFHVFTEISVWSWKFAFKSWKSPGNPSVKMCKNPAMLTLHSRDSDNLFRQISHLKLNAVGCLCLELSRFTRFYLCVSPLLHAKPERQARAQTDPEWCSSTGPFCPG